MPMPNPDIAVVSLRGGMNDTDPPNALPDDQCVDATNIEWFYSTFGERRAGCDPLSMTGSGLTGNTHIVHLSQWYPNNDITNPVLWAVSATPGNAGTAPTVAYRAGTSTGSPTWFAVTVTDVITANTPNIFQLRTQGLNQKLFFAYPSGIDRLHLWDGATLRLVGLAEPDAPTAANTGSGAYSGVRYFRVRYIQQDSTGAIVRRSEPSNSVTFTPSGAGSGALITRASTTSALNSHSDEGQTHWELEGSADNTTFYLLQTLPFSTTTATDTTSMASSYADVGTLSDALGAYTLIPSAAFLATDGDRLLWGGHYTDPAQMSTVGWTPEPADPGVGNDERLPLVTTGGASVNNTRNLDNGAGGPLTGLASAVNGVFYAFKYGRIYRGVRTGDVTNAYDIKMISDTRGAIPGSVFSGINEDGGACVYFLDPVFGPSRIDSGGPMIIKGLRKTWGRVNLKAANVVAHGVFYPYKQQAWWWVAVDGADSPGLILKLQASEVGLLDRGGAGRGWSLATGRIAQAYCSGLYTEWVNDGGNISLSTRPFIGLNTPDFVQRCDVDTTDAGQSYNATITTRPYILTGVLNKWGAMVGALLATALSGGTVKVRLIRDFGVETTSPITVALDPAGSESFVFKLIDNLHMSGAYAIQIQVSDT